jgi:predicted transcriptional regulator of viral defense system
MPELSGFGSTPRNKSQTVQLSALAARQWGVASARQLRELGLSRATISRWTATGRLHRVHPGVYAVGHTRLSTEGRLVAALLYARPGAMLSHTTAAWWWQLIDHQPMRIQIGAPGFTRSLPGVLIHHPRHLDPVEHRGLPTTTVAQTLVDFAVSATADRLRRALAEADFRRLLDRNTIDTVLVRGRPGTAALRRCLESHYPDLARTRSVLEERFLSLCRSGGIPLPEVNVKLGGLTVDALWREQRVIVELDGHAGHGTPAQLERDHQRDLRLRTAGYLVLRYTWQQITQQREQVIADLWATLLAPR